MLEAREDKPITTAPHDDHEPGGHGRPRRHGARMDRADLAPGREPGAGAPRRRARPLDDDVVLGERGRPAAARRSGASRSTSAAWLTIAVQLGFVAGALVSSVLNVADVDLAPDRHPRGRDWAPPGRTRSSGSSPAPAARSRSASSPGSSSQASTRRRSSSWRPGSGAGAGRRSACSSARSPSARRPPTSSTRSAASTGSTVVYATSALTLAGGLLALAVRDGPYPFPQATFDPHQARRVFANRGVRLASLGYFGHMWELYAMWAWFVVFYSTAVDGGCRTPPTRPSR